MDIVRLSEWLQVIAAVGVLAGLLLVAYELRQNQELARAQLNSDSLAVIEQVALSRQNESLARALAKSYESPEQLTVHEALMIDGYYRQILDNLQREHAFVLRGIYDDQRDFLARFFASHVLSSEFGRVWWEETKVGASSSLVQIVEAEAANMEIAEMNDVIERFRQRLSEPDR